MISLTALTITFGHLRQYGNEKLVYEPQLYKVL